MNISKVLSSEQQFRQQEVAPTAGSEDDTQLDQQYYLKGSESSEAAKRGGAATHKHTKRGPVTSRACDYCRRLHERCDGAQPCGRCTQRGKTCEYTDAGQMNKRAKVASPKAEPMMGPMNPSPQHFWGPFAPKPMGTQFPPFMVPPAAGPPEVPQNASGIPPFVQAMMRGESGGPPMGGPPMMGGNPFADRNESRLLGRQKQLRLLEDTFKTVLDPAEAAKLVKYQLAFFNHVVGLWEDLNIPETSVLSAMQPIYAHVSAEDICSAVEHLVILGTGAMIYADAGYSLSLLKLADQLIDRLCFEQSLRIRGDLLSRSVCFRVLLAVSFFQHGQVKRSAALLVSCFNNVNNALQGNALNPQLFLQVLAFGWAFHGDEANFEAARQLCPRGLAEPEIGLAFGHALRRLHGEIPVNYRVSAMLFEDTNNVDDLLMQLQTRKKPAWQENTWQMTLMLNAARAILSLDVGADDLALKHAMATLSIVRTRNPENSHSFVVPASTAIAMRVFLHADNAAAVEECKALLTPWGPYVPVSSTWLTLVPQVHLFSQQIHISADSPTSEDDFNWGEAASAAGLLFDEDLGLFLGLAEPVSPQML